MIKKIIEILRNPVDYSFAERAELAEWLDRKEPVGSISKGIFRPSTNGGPDAHRKNIQYEGKLFAVPMPPFDLIALCDDVYNAGIIDVRCDTYTDLDAIIAKYTKGGV